MLYEVTDKCSSDDHVNTQKTDPPNDNPNSKKTDSLIYNNDKSETRIETATPQNTNSQVMPHVTTDKGPTDDNANAQKTESLMYNKGSPDDHVPAKKIDPPNDNPNRNPNPNDNPNPKKQTL